MMKIESVKIIEGHVAKFNNQYWGYFGYYDGYTKQMGDFGSIETAEIAKTLSNDGLDFITSYDYERNPNKYQDLIKAEIIKIKKTITTTFES